MPSFQTTFSLTFWEATERVRRVRELLPFQLRLPILLRAVVTIRTRPRPCSLCAFSIIPTQRRLLLLLLHPRTMIKPGQKCLHPHPRCSFTRTRRKRPMCMAMFIITAAIRVLLRFILPPTEVHAIHNNRSNPVTANPVRNIRTVPSRVRHHRNILSTPRNTSLPLPVPASPVRPLRCPPWRPRSLLERDLEAFSTIPVTIITTNSRTTSSINNSNNTYSASRRKLRWDLRHPRNLPFHPPP